MKTLLEGETGGAPSGRGRKWVRRSLRFLARHLVPRLCPNTLRRLLREADYGLRANVKRLSGPPHPERDRQFRFIAKVRARYLRAQAPVLSVDTKHKVLIGNFKNPGRRWCAQAEAVNTYDFPHDALYQARLYGIYEVNHNRGHVGVGISADTAQFAVHTIRQWWRRYGTKRFAGHHRLLLLADGGGSNGYRSRLWKRELQQWADDDRLELVVCHYPRGTSKWNWVEHRLFGPIAINWAGEPLASLEKLLSLIRGTTTETGLRVTATLDRRTYPTKLKVSDREMQQLNLHPRKICPRWNYVIKPRPKKRK